MDPEVWADLAVSAELVGAADLADPAGAADPVDLVGAPDPVDLVGAAPLEAPAAPVGRGGGADRVKAWVSRGCHSSW